MNVFKITCLLFGFITLLSSCRSNVKIEDEDVTQALLQNRYSKLLEYPLDSLSFPRSMTPSTGFINKVPSKDWTSGFFAGNLWQLYQLTGNEAFKEKAALWTAFIEKEKYNNKTHDMGFKVF